MEFLGLNVLKTNLMIAEGTSGSQFLTTALNGLSSLAVGFGAIYAAWGGIVLFSALKDHNGPDIKNGLLQLIGGVGICAIGAMIKGISISFG